MRCATPPSMDKSCAASVYPSRRRLCASRRSRSDAPVIRRKTPPRRQRVLSPSPAQWSPGSSPGLWCKSFLFILQKKSAPVTEGLGRNCGSWLLRPFETMRAPVCTAIRFRIRRQRVNKSRYRFINFWLETDWIPVDCTLPCRLR